MEEEEEAEEAHGRTRDATHTWRTCYRRDLFTASPLNSHETLFPPLLSSDLSNQSTHRDRNSRRRRPSSAQLPLPPHPQLERRPQIDRPDPICLQPPPSSSMQRLVLLLLLFESG
ncbi:hypothetical protein NL676_017795 [Syzygium grande]|nr:hypothetical protein NL676_017795 [Syzygium grande]